ncbi:MAG: prephenate/arogenate dehydrogenase [Microcoleaceae cyanobacterium]
MKIGIVGLGLIGGSIGLELSTVRNSPTHFSHRFQAIAPSEPWLNTQILGVSRRQQTCERAVALGAVDTASENLASLAEADIVLICTPIGLIQPTIEQLVPILQPNAIITDVGSVKQPIVESIDQLWPNFVGGHPMAGTAEQGIDAALLNLFVNRPYVITPSESTPTAATQAVTHLAQVLGANVIQCSAADHDQAVAWISHLPVMVSASLIAATQTEQQPSVMQLACQLASSGFRDTSRVGGGNPELGMMMAQYNRQAVLRSLSAYRQALDQITEQIEQENWPALAEKLTQTQSDRGKFNL